MNKDTLQYHKLEYYLPRIRKVDYVQNLSDVRYIIFSSKKCYIQGVP